MTETVALKPKDYASNQDVRWCPGCGNYSIIKGVQKVLAEKGVDPHNTVFVSGIGCAARFPYYMETYGFHTIHGRAPAVASGLKLANADLDVWIVSGDGDSLAIGGNHLLHLLRRNVDVTYLLLNNEIYGLTKGQASPTSRPGTRSPTSLQGSKDQPVQAGPFALGSGGRFFARAVDTTLPVLVEAVARAHQFNGTGFVEILQNCIVYNDAIFADLEDKKKVAETQLHLRHGEPMLYGAEKNKGLVFDPEHMVLKKTVISGDGMSEADILVHDETNRDMAWLLAHLEAPEFPLPVGVLYAEPLPSFSEQQSQLEVDFAKRKTRLQQAIEGGHTWRVKAS